MHNVGLSLSYKNIAHVAVLIAVHCNQRKLQTLIYFFIFLLLSWKTSNCAKRTPFYQHSVCALLGAQTGGKTKNNKLKKLFNDAS